MMNKIVRNNWMPSKRLQLPQFYDPLPLIAGRNGKFCLGDSFCQIMKQCSVRQIRNLDILTTLEQWCTCVHVADLTAR